MDDFSDDSGSGDSLDSDFTSDSGNSPYSTDTLGSDTGGVFNASATPLTAPPDASGGNGSYASSLQSTLTTGINDALVSATEFGLGSLVDRITVGANAQASPAAAPGTVPNVGSSIPWGLLIIGALGVFLVVKAVKG